MSGTTDDIMILIIGGIAGYLLLRTCTLQQAVDKLGVTEVSNIVNQIGQMVGASCAAAPPPTTGGGGTPTGTGGTSTGTNIYPVVGPIADTGDTRISSAGSGSGGSSERDNRGFDCSKCSRETTWIFVPGNGGDWSVKMGSHGRTGGSDDDSIGAQWEQDFGSNGGGWRCEGPYGKFSDMSGSGSGANISGSGQVGLKGISWSTGGNTMHHEVWFNETGDGQSWTQIATFDGTSPCGNPFKCPVPASGGGAHCQDTLRIDDNNGSKFISSSIVEISPGGTPTTAYTKAKSKSRLGNATKIRNYNELRKRSLVPQTPMVFR